MKKHFLIQRSREELRTIAKNLDVSGYEKMNKEKLNIALPSCSFSQLLKALADG